MSESLKAPPLWHPKNIVYGTGRVIYVNGHNLQPSGWHLPGGRITTDEAEALRCAVEIDRLTKANSPQGLLPVANGVMTWP
jgi:hypothetical protein